MNEAVSSGVSSARRADMQRSRRCEENRCRQTALVHENTVGDGHNFILIIQMGRSWISSAYSHAPIKIESTSAAWGCQAILSCVKYKFSSNCKRKWICSVTREHMKSLQLRRPDRQLAALLPPQTSQEEASLIRFRATLFVSEYSKLFCLASTGDNNPNWWFCSRCLKMAFWELET